LKGLKIQAGTEIFGGFFTPPAKMPHFKMLPKSMDASLWFRERVKGRRSFLHQISVALLMNSEPLSLWNSKTGSGTVV
jgi:hypothetical protein